MQITVEYFYNVILRIYYCRSGGKMVLLKMSFFFNVCLMIMSVGFIAISTNFEVHWANFDSMYCYCCGVFKLMGQVYDFSPFYLFIFTGLEMLCNIW